MKRYKLLWMVIIFFLISTTFYLWNNYRLKLNFNPNKYENKKCGIENCHGLQISCGPNIPEACDLMYTIGDKCRQYAKCELIHNKCELIIDEEFSKCKSCVENCQTKYQNDPISLSTCESDC